MISEKSAGLVNVGSERFCLLTAVNSTAVDGEGTEVDLGAAGDLVTYEVNYEWPVFTPWLKIQSLFGESVHFKSVTLVRNERFIDMGDVRTASARWWL